MSLPEAYPNIHLKTKSLSQASKVFQTSYLKRICKIYQAQGEKNRMMGEKYWKREQRYIVYYTIDKERVLEDWDYWTQIKKKTPFTKC